MVKETSAKLWKCIQKGKIEIPARRMALNIDTVSNELMALHVLRFTTVHKTPHAKVIFDIYTALKIRLPDTMGKFV